MTKTKEELNELKNEYEKLNKKLKELTEDELKLVTGGIGENGIRRDSIKCCSRGNEPNDGFCCNFNVDSI